MSTAVKKKSAVLDRIVVKRPAPPPELLQGAAQPPVQPPTAVNPDFEQKPLAELNLQTSEDFHGGSELAFSMPTQRGGSMQNKGGGGETQQQGGGKADTEPEDAQRGGIKRWGARRAQQREESGPVHQPTQASQKSEEDASQKSQRGRQREEGTGTAEERGEEMEELDRDDEGVGDQTGVFNTEQAVNISERPQMSDFKRLQTEFYRILEMLAEEKTKFFDPSLVGSLVKAEYDVKKMALRRYEGKPPTRYKAPRVRKSVVLVLDNSGSMFSWADTLRAMAELAARRRDVEVYLAPNGYVEEQIAPVKRKVSHEEFMRRMSGRKIIYVGDFDGANTPIELSWRNEVIWIAPEGRYRRFKSHSWVKYDESKYKGAFIRAFNIDDVMEGFKKALGDARWIDMCKKCGDEEKTS